MISPFVFIHPSEKNEQQVDQSFLIKWESFSIYFQISDYFIGNVNDVIGLVCFPIIIVVFFSDKKFKIVYEACQDLLLFAIVLNQFQKLTRHVLTGLITLTTLESLIVVNGFIEEGFLELLDAIIVQDRMVILNILN